MLRLVIIACFLGETEKTGGKLVVIFFVGGVTSVVFFAGEAEAEVKKS